MKLLLTVLEFSAIKNKFPKLLKVKQKLPMQNLLMKEKKFTMSSILKQLIPRSLR